jgi:hypothetical protein
MMSYLILAQTQVWVVWGWDTPFRDMETKPSSKTEMAQEALLVSELRVHTRET